ncbi:MAG: hypothetical protein Q9M48_08910, partial [Rhodobacterales bacterium]|nr:hypothetical protein [Rhodobacterales bacterium]
PQLVAQTVLEVSRVRPPEVILGRLLGVNAALRSVIPNMVAGMGSENVSHEQTKLKARIRAANHPLKRLARNLNHTFVVRHPRRREGMQRGYLQPM